MMICGGNNLQTKRAKIDRDEMKCKIWFFSFFFFFVVDEW